MHSDAQSRFQNDVSACGSEKHVTESAGWIQNGINRSDVRITIDFASGCVSYKVSDFQKKYLHLCVMEMVCVP